MQLMGVQANANRLLTITPEQPVIEHEECESVFIIRCVCQPGVHKLLAASSTVHFGNQLRLADEQETEAGQDRAIAWERLESLLLIRDCQLDDILRSALLKRNVEGHLATVTIQDRIERLFLDRLGE